MSVHHRAQILGLVLALPAIAGAQSLPTYALVPVSPPQALDRGPAFYAITSSGHRESIDAGHTIALKRRISLQLDHVSIPTALHAIELQTDFRFTYDPAMLPLDATVSLHASDIAVAAALTQVLLDANVDIEMAPTGLVSLRARQQASQVIQQATGSISGRVKDGKSGNPMADVTVTINNTTLAATTNSKGEYRIANVVAGTYTVIARRVGYTASRVSISVVDGQGVTVNLALEPAPTELTRMITTGTIVPTPVRAVPTPVTVITDSAIADRQAWSITQIVQQAVPSAVAVTLFTSPQTTEVSFRGASSLTGYAGTVKIYIDGIEAADRAEDAIDPNSIDHIEIIRGPEAATLYGSDAIGGVIQIFTKHGDSTSTHPHVNLQTALGAIQSPYSGYSGAFDQANQGSVLGGNANSSYGFGGSYSRNGAWVVNGQSAITSGWGGVHILQGPIGIDLSGRMYETHTPEALNPDLEETGFVFVSKPFYYEWDTHNETAGAHITYATTSWWRQTLTLGIDRIAGDGRSTQARFTTPADSFLYVSAQNENKTYVAFNTAVAVHVAHDLSLNLVAGLDHYDYLEYLITTTGATSTVSGISSPGGAPSWTRNPVINTGYFTQEELAWRNALFLTAGVRAEQNSSFGSSLGTPVSPRVGVSYVKDMGSISLKARSSFGEAIDPPDPYYAAGSQVPPFTTLPNRLLGPERQQGWDAGIDLLAGTRGSAGVTYYDQEATGLIEFVPLDTLGLVNQYQNVGRVRNSGIELEGAVTIGVLQLHAQYGYVNARTESLGANYTGDQRVGDQVLTVPHATGGAAATITPTHTTRVTAGLTYLGSLVDYNELAEFSCFGGTGRCQPTSRGYLIRYPAFVRINLSASQQLWRMVSVFISVDDLNNALDYQGGDLSPIQGRVTMAGLRFNY